MPSSQDASPARASAGDDLLRLLVECVTDYAIFMLDPGGHVTSWNPGARRLKGWEADEIIGRHFSAFYPAEDVAAGKPDRELVEAEAVGRFEDEGWRVRKDGSRFWANVVITAVRDREGVLRGFGKVTRDLTARKQAEEAERNAAAERARAEAQARAMLELRRAEEEAREIGRLQERLVAIVGHDLRTPLSVIQLGVGSVIQRGGLGPEQERTLARVARSVQRMRGIIDDLLDFSRARQGVGIPVKLEPSDLAEVCRRALAELGPLSAGRALTLAAQGDTRLSGDPSRLLQVASNLVGNAMQHGTGPVEVELWGAPDEVVLQVKNQGSPIPREVLPTIFEPFRRGEGIERKGGSIGLGLFIVREVVRAHGGDVAVRSDAGGTVFTVRLPRTAAARQPAAEGTSAAAP